MINNHVEFADKFVNRFLLTKFKLITKNNELYKSNLNNTNIIMVTYKDIGIHINDCLNI